MGLNRRKFIQSIAVGTAGWALADFRCAKAAPTEDDHLVLSAPLTHSDWMLKAGMKWGIPGVEHMLDACKACGWSQIYWRVFDAGLSTYKSSLLKPASHVEDDNYFNPQNDADRQQLQRFSPSVTPVRAEEILAQLEKIDYGQFDSLAAAIDYGHRIGLKIHAWATINEDDHGWGWRSEFAKAHPEFRWVRHDGRPYRSQLSFAFPEVRKYKLALIDELLTNYDLDGLFIDWIRTGDVRDNPQTDAAGVADSGYERPNVEAFRRQHGIDPQDVNNDDERWVQVRAEPQTVFMRALREQVARHSKPVPIAVMVGHPWHYRGLQDPIAGNERGLLLDVATWAKEVLIDAAVAAGYYRAGGSAEKAYQSLVEETGGKVDVWYYGWVPSSVAEFDAEFAAAQKLGANRILFWEADYIDDRANAAELNAAMAGRARLSGNLSLSRKRL